LLRLQLLLVRLHQGEPLHVAATGGSNMINCYDHYCFHYLVFQWLNASTFEAAAAARMRQRAGGGGGGDGGEHGDDQGSCTNGGLNGMGSGYFARCLNGHVPKHANLFLTEGAINDRGGSAEADVHKLSLKVLRRSATPALVHVALMRETFNAMGAERQHSVVSGLLGVPAVSVRRAVFPQFLSAAAQHRDHFSAHNSSAGHWLGFSDGSHMGEAGHRIAAEQVIYLLRSAWAYATCELGEDGPLELASASALATYAAVLRRRLQEPAELLVAIPSQELALHQRWAGADEVNESGTSGRTISSLRLAQRQRLHSLQVPKCWSVISPWKDFQTRPKPGAEPWLLIRPKLPWYAAHKYPPGDARRPQAWSTNTVGATCVFDVDVAGKGTINFFFLKSPFQKHWVEGGNNAKEKEGLGVMECNTTVAAAAAAAATDGDDSDNRRATGGRDQLLHKNNLTIITQSFDAAAVQQEYSIGGVGVKPLSGLTPGTTVAVECTLVKPGRFLLYAVFSE